MNSKTVWVISDGIPGHFNQSKGVVLALQYLFATEVCWVEVRLKSGIYRRLLSFLLNHFNLPLGFFSIFYTGTLPEQRPNIIVGAGGRASFAVSWLGKAYQAKTIFAGSLRQLKPELFTAVLNLEPHSHPAIMTVSVSPMPINQQVLKHAADTWRGAHGQPEATLWAMLIGGNGAGAHYQDSDWQMLAMHMNRLAEKNNIQWLITTSRRSGKSAEQVLRQSLNPLWVAEAVWWSEAPRPVTSSYLGLSQVVYCTVDSMSMIMESVCAMRPVVVVKPQQFTPEANFQKALDRLQQQKLLLQAGIGELEAREVNRLQLKPLDQEPLQALASRLQPRLEK